MYQTILDDQVESQHRKYCLNFIFILSIYHWEFKSINTRDTMIICAIIKKWNKLEDIKDKFLEMFNNNHEVYNRHFSILFNNLQYKLNKDEYFNK